jgi:PAS domain-containing protein
MVFKSISAIDLTLLSLHWVHLSDGECAVLRNNGLPLPDSLAKTIIDTAYDKISRSCAQRGFSRAYLYAQSTARTPKRYTIDAAIAMVTNEESKEEIQKTSESNKTLEESFSSENQREAILTIPEKELAIASLENSPLPTYINAIASQKKFYANPTALAAQGKPPEDFLTGNAYDLNDPDELDYRTSRIASGETLRAYEYEAWRWYFDADAGRFRLKRMQLVSNFRLLTSFNGVPCWLGQVIQASELTKRQL